MSRPLLRLYDGYDSTSPDLADEVTDLQVALKAAGMVVDVDGKFGPGTERAVRRFQRRKGLPDHGIADAATWTALLGPEALPAPAAGPAFPTTYPRTDAGLLAQEAAARQWEATITAEAARHGIPRGIVLGIGSRESEWGLSAALRPTGAGATGTGDWTPRSPRPPLRPGRMPPDGLGFGRGLMQIDFDSHAFARGPDWRVPEKNIAYGCRVLRDNREFLRARRPLSDTQLLRAAIAAYNCGAGNVLRALDLNLDVDFYTAHRDYSKEVINRAGWFQLHGW